MKLVVLDVAIVLRNSVKQKQKLLKNGIRECHDKMKKKYEKQENKQENKKDQKKYHKKILAILIGPPGSGKSYYCQHCLYNYFRISQDDFKKAYYRKFLEILLSGIDLIVIDRQNFSVEQRLRFVLPAQRFGYKISYYVFSAPDDICIKRMRNRKNHPTIKTNDHETQKKVLEFFKNNYEEQGDLEQNFEIIEVKTGEEPLNDERNLERYS